MTSNALCYVSHTLSIWFLTYNYVDTIYLCFFIQATQIQLCVLVSVCWMHEREHGNTHRSPVYSFISQHTFTTHLWIIFFYSVETIFTSFVRIRQTPAVDDRHTGQEIERMSESSVYGVMNKCMMMNTTRRVCRHTNGKSVRPPTLMQWIWFRYVFIARLESLCTRTVYRVRTGGGGALAAVQKSMSVEIQYTFYVILWLLWLWIL